MIDQEDNCTWVSRRYFFYELASVKKTTSAQQATSALVNRICFNSAVYINFNQKRQALFSTPFQPGIIIKNIVLQDNCFSCKTATNTGPDKEPN